MIPGTFFFGRLAYNILQFLSYFFLSFIGFRFRSGFLFNISLGNHKHDILRTRQVLFAFVEKLVEAQHTGNNAPRRRRTSVSNRRGVHLRLVWGGRVLGRGYHLHRGLCIREWVEKEEAHARYRSIEEREKYGPTLWVAFSYLHGRSDFYPCNCFSDIFLLFFCFISGDDT